MSSGDPAGSISSLESSTPFYELTCVLEVGMSSMGVLVACTCNAAQVSHVDSNLGTLEAGKIANVLVVKGNLLADLNARSRVRLVIHDDVNSCAERL
jgi:imidazolonepropionase-like amidohydrolase